MLAYHQLGEGNTVVLIHGFCEDKSVWNDFAQALSFHYRIIAVDLPGFGESPCLEQPTIEGYADEVAQLLTAMKVDTCVMIGHSLGGYVALAFAELYPERLKGFGLFHSTAFADSEEKKANRTKAIEFVTQHGAAPFVTALIPTLFTPENRIVFAKEIALLIERAIHNPWQGIVGASTAMRERKDRTSVLTDFSKPILFIIGKEDASVPLASSMEQCHLPSQGLAYFLANTAHMGMLEQRNQCLSAVLGFVQHCHNLIVEVY